VLFLSGGAELASRGMKIDGLEFQCFTSRYNILEVRTTCGAAAAIIKIHIPVLPYFTTS
jgi:hypothetical protein